MGHGHLAQPVFKACFAAFGRAEKFQNDLAHGGTHTAQFIAELEMILKAGIPATQVHFGIKHRNALLDIVDGRLQQIAVVLDGCGGIIEEPQPIPAEEKIRRMRFEEAPVAEIFSALERVYGVDIVFDKNQLSSCVLTTSISDGGIYNRLDIICEAIGAEYTVNEGEIVITGSGCD